MRKNDAQIIHTELIECVESVMSSHGLRAELGARPPWNDLAPGQVIPSICFDGPHFRGSLTLVATPSLLRASYPVPRAAPGPDLEALTDWACEAVNQILGRLKNRLHAYGATLEVSPPKTMPAEQLTPQRYQHAICTQRYRAGDETFDVWFEAEADKEFALVPESPVSAAMAEGDLLLF